MLTQAQKFVLGNLGSNLQHVKIINKNCWGVRKFKLYTQILLINNTKKAICAQVAIVLHS